MNGTPEMNPPPPAMQDQWLTKTGSVLMTIFRPKGTKEEGDGIWAVLGNRLEGLYEARVGDELPIPPEVSSKWQKGQD